MIPNMEKLYLLNFNYAHISKLCALFFIPGRNLIRGLVKYQTDQKIICAKLKEDGLKIAKGLEGQLNRLKK